MKKIENGRKRREKLKKTPWKEKSTSEKGEKIQSLGFLLTLEWFVKLTAELSQTILLKLRVSKNQLFVIVLEKQTLGPGLGTLHFHRQENAWSQKLHKIRQLFEEGSLSDTNQSSLSGKVWSFAKHSAWLQLITIQPFANQDLEKPELNNRSVGSYELAVFSQDTWSSLKSWRVNIHSFLNLVYPTL